MPISSEIMLCVACGPGSFALSSFNSTMKRLRTDIKRDCARTPITSAYKSAIMWILAALGSVWILWKKNCEYEKYILICSKFHSYICLLPFSIFEMFEGNVFNV